MISTHYISISSIPPKPNINFKISLFFSELPYKTVPKKEENKKKNIDKSKIYAGVYKKVAIKSPM